MTQEISSEGVLLALIADASGIAEGIYPLTDTALPLQSLMRKHKKGHLVPMHSHKRISKTTEQLNEGLVVISGTLSVTISNNENKNVGVYAVSAGQCLLMLDGWHSVEVAEDAVFYEFKNGPYIEDKVVM